MRNITRLPLGPIATIVIFSASSAAADSGHKTPRECNAELYSRLAEIKATGETPAQFVHDCWHRSRPGQATSLGHRGTASSSPSREADAAPARPPARHRVVAAHRESPRHEGSRPVGEARRAAPRAAPRAVEARRTELARRMARALRAARVRLALVRHAVPSDKVAVRSRRGVATSEVAPRHVRRERFAEVNPIRRAEPVRPARTWADRSVPAAVATAVAELGPTARAGRRMWVRVVAADEVDIKPAIAVGGLAERASAGALNCWGQPVLHVGRASGHWSRDMVCDGRPAGANEWSATIYYGGPAGT